MSAAQARPRTAIQVLDETLNLSTASRSVVEEAVKSWDLNSSLDAVCLCDCVFFAWPVLSLRVLQSLPRELRPSTSSRQFRRASSLTPSSGAVLLHPLLPSSLITSHSSPFAVKAPSVPDILIIPDVPDELPPPLPSTSGLSSNQSDDDFLEGPRSAPLHPSRPRVYVTPSLSLLSLHDTFISPSFSMTCCSSLPLLTHAQASRRRWQH